MKYLLLCLVAVHALEPVSWTKFKDMFAKEYDVEEEKYRGQIYLANLKKIQMHNAGNHTWTMGVNQFADLTPTEFKAYIKNSGGYRPKMTFNFRHLNLTAADSVDWTTRGAVTPVKNQGQCGSCWTFSTTGALEGAYFNKYGSLFSFSEQQIVSCDYGGSGCNGGSMEQAFGFVQSNGGVCAESTYPYTSGTSGITGTCVHGCTVVPNSAPSGYSDVTPNDEDALKQALNLGPVSVAIEADKDAFQFYSGGVLTDTSCGQQLDHGVLAVGYGSENGQNFWKVKNSWGEMWGDQGYIKLGRGIESGGECGILLDPSYPHYN